jgi:CheY-like chemotaxis protein
MTNPLDYVERRTVLVVDDVPDNLTLMSGILKGAYHVKVARSGQRALEIVHSDTPPDIVLLDVMMPEMDGFEVMRRIRADVRSNTIPVIFVTAMTEAANEEAGFELGAVDYLTKPVIPAVMLARIKTHLALSERTRMLRELSGKLSRYLAPQVYQMIFEGVQDTSIHAKRKKLTLFFFRHQGFHRDNREPAARGSDLPAQ